MNNKNENINSDIEFEKTLYEYFGKGSTFKDLKDMDDESMEAIYGIAYNLYQAGKYEESQKIFQFLCFYDHFNQKYFMGLGACQLMLKCYDKAIELFTLATILDSEDPRPLVYIGDCYIGLGKNDEAKEAYETSLKWSNDDKKCSHERKKAEAMIDSLINQ